MKRNKESRPAGLALMLSVLLAFGNVLPAAAETTSYGQYVSGEGAEENLMAESEYTVIVLSTEEELRRLARDCALDSWSRDKCVKLAGDIELKEETDLVIPSFGGIFDGCGYRITGLDISGAGSSMGLFRYVQAGGTVRNLTVSGRVCPEGSSSQAGLLAGVNYGKIIGCSVSGTAAGAEKIGGIAGINEAGGEIRNCRSDAVVTGNHYTGGICGINRGTLNNCRNTGSINTYSMDVTFAIEDITLENLEDREIMEQVAVHTDTGGITGYSEGKIYYCANSGTVGYQHVGYNIGGIVGRLHQGYLQSCTNTGHVLGRKDVGGIAGQMEPFLEIQYLNDALSEIDAEADIFFNLLEAAQEDLDNYGGQAGDLTRSISRHLSNASAAAGNLTGTANELWYIYNQELTGINDDLRRLNQEWTDQAEADRDKVDKDEPELPHFTVSGNEVIPPEGSWGGNLEITSPVDVESYLAALRRFGEGTSGHLGNITDATYDRSGGINDNLNRLNEEMSAAGDELQQLADVLDQGGSEISGDVDALIAQAKVLRGLISGLRDHLFRYEGISIEDNSDEAAGRAGDNPGAEPSAPAEPGGPVSGEADSQGTSAPVEPGGPVSGEADSQGTSAPAEPGGPVSGETDSQGTSAPAEPGMSDSGEAGDRETVNQGADFREEVYYDTSSFQQGKITLCINTGAVEADTNVGGIAGLVATEYDFDPEDDITISGTESFHIEQTVKAVIRESRNLGDITGKKDYVGGVVGKADYGAVISCESYGKVESTDGSYVGGIAGASGYCVRSCYSMGVLSGINYVGGIVGSGCDVFYSYAYPELDYSGEYAGSIAGQLKEEGILFGNYYVQGNVPGVDSIGYEGGAAPLDYEEFSSREGVPEAFSLFTISFQADGKELASFSCRYGESLDKKLIPEIPEKEGYYSSWPAFNYDFITGNKVLEADYEKWISVLASEEKDESGRTLVLVEGQFLPEYRLVLEQREEGTALCIAAVKEDEAKEDGVREDRIQYDKPIIVRILQEKGNNAQVELWDGNSYRQVPAESIGSYLEFAMEKPGTFRIVIPERDGRVPMILVYAGAGALIFLLILIPVLAKSRRGKRHREKRT